MNPEEVSGAAFSKSYGKRHDQENRMRPVATLRSTPHKEAKLFLNLSFWAQHCSQGRVMSDGRTQKKPP
ncbi:hypothetical protein [Acetobacter sicerae]|uniref:hypothetical protein n=1 Tax=Acetobacter sicerae TaxID=85325 RepID=UPI001A7E81EF|nr:hypothetical protein [Acetobacter sicerae]